MALQSTFAALDAAGPEADAARYEGQRMGPRNALAKLVATPP